MALTNEEQQQYEVSAKEVTATANFLSNFQDLRRNTEYGLVACYDSCHNSASENDTLDSNIPKALVDIFDNTGPESRKYILGAIEKGISDYKALNGGEMPRADMIATALSSAAMTTRDQYDSTVNGTQLSASGMETLSVNPAQAIAIISTQIANSMPLIAYLPNPTGSNQLPIVYGRTIAKSSFGAVKAGEYLDGTPASLQYFDPIFEFEAVKDATTPTKYEVLPTVTYNEDGTKTPNANAAVLPFKGGRVRVFVEGVEVGSDATFNHAKFDGESQIIATAGHNLKVKNAAGDLVAVKLVSGVANLTTHKIEVVFSEELADDVMVSFELIADYERTKDNSEEFMLSAPSVDLDLTARSVFAYPMRARYRATREAINQKQRELNLDMRGATTAVVSSKFQLEQNIRLLNRLKRRAKGFGRVLVADLSRGATDTAVFNNTAEQSRELLVTISAAKVIINSLVDIVPTTHDIFVTDKMSVLFDNLADDTHYTKISSAVGAPNQITRIGQIKGNTNVYHVPKDSKLLTETGASAEILLVGRSGDPVRNPCVGFVTSPVTVRESTTQDFVAGVTIEASQAADVNPLDRFADQNVLIQVTNLPASVSGV